MVDPRVIELVRELDEATQRMAEIEDDLIQERANLRANPNDDTRREIRRLEDLRVGTQGRIDYLNRQLVGVPRQAQQPAPNPGWQAPPQPAPAQKRSLFRWIALVLLGVLAAIGGVYLYLDRNSVGSGINTVIEVIGDGPTLEGVISRECLGSKKVCARYGHGNSLFGQDHIENPDHHIYAVYRSEGSDSEYSETLLPPGKYFLPWDLDGTETDIDPTDEVTIDHIKARPRYKEWTDEAVAKYFTKVDSTAPPATPHPTPEPTQAPTPAPTMSLLELADALWIIIEPDLDAWSEKAKLDLSNELDGWIADQDFATGVELQATNETIQALADEFRREEGIEVTVVVPTPHPTQTPRPTATPSPEPTPVPVPTEVPLPDPTPDPTPEPVHTPESTPKPTPVPTAQPATAGIQVTITPIVDDAEAEPAEAEVPEEVQGSTQPAEDATAPEVSTVEIADNTAGSIAITPSDAKVPPPVDPTKYGLPSVAERKAALEAQEEAAQAEESTEEKAVPKACLEMKRKKDVPVGFWKRVPHKGYWRIMEGWTNNPGFSQKLQKLFLKPHDAPLTLLGGAIYRMPKKCSQAQALAVYNDAVLPSWGGKGHKNDLKYLRRIGLMR